MSADIWYSTEDVCAQCRRPFNSEEDLRRWRETNYGLVPPEVAEPLWAARLCWAREWTGIMCHCDPRKIAERIKRLELEERLATLERKVLSEYDRMWGPLPGSLGPYPGDP